MLIVLHPRSCVSVVHTVALEIYALATQTTTEFARNWKEAKKRIRRYIYLNRKSALGTKGIRVVAGKIEGYGVHRFCRSCKESFGTITRSETLRHII
jgi:hypothetical protein